MENYKKFVQTIQTVNITVGEEVDAGIERSVLSLRNENPAFSVSYKSTLETLVSLSSLELLALSPEIMKVQILQLERIEFAFDRFWRIYYSKPEPFTDNERSDLFYSLNLEDFILTGISIYDSGLLVKQTFIDDLYDSILARQEYCVKLKMLVGNSEYLIPNQNEGKHVEKISKYPIFINDDFSRKFLHIICPFFSVSDQHALYELILNRVEPTAELWFRSNGNMLADAFKQLYMANLIVGCSKIELQRWVKLHFNYSDGINRKKFSDKYLGDVISSNTKQCQSPILDVHKSSSGFEIVAIDRQTRDEKGWG